MTKWLITGGAGFIGTNFVRTLSETEFEQIVILDALTYAGNIENIADCLDQPAIEFVHGNICDDALVNRLFDQYGFDIVANFAAESHVDRSINDSSKFVETNVNGTYCLLNAARRAWPEGSGAKKFIQVSTDEVYGDLDPDDRPFTERSPYKPSSPYSASKASADHLVRAWNRTYGVPTIVTNCSNNYGSWQFPEKFIPLMITNALQDLPLPLYGDGLNRRDWLHVQDHCDALLRVAKSGEAGETYLIGGGCEMSNRDVLTLICDAVDQKLQRAIGSSAELITPVPDRPGHDRRYAVDATFIRDRLGWTPQRELQTSVVELVDWYVNHADWVDRIKSGDYREFYRQQYRILSSNGA